MKHSIHLDRLDGALPGAVRQTYPSFFRRRLARVSSVVAASLLATFALPLRADADPAPATTATPPSPASAEGSREKEQFAKLIQAQVETSSWKLDERTFSGKDLIGKGLELTVSEIKWDDSKVYFVLTIAPTADLQTLLATHKHWTFNLACGYSRTAGEAGQETVLKLTNTAVAFPKKSTASRSPTPGNVGRIIKRPIIRPF